ncbi:hypothetical protein Enr17x_14830 [Gimesia fumaroli]|uniref:Uncharacterized protein n=1 Tax=Gimesia fumaroli TaxID=2527976 RepID=A0A518I8N2_9PLAN|nr:hypothetical protein Enr17x_14830 [Gimesia fumaroli]
MIYMDFAEFADCTDYSCQEMPILDVRDTTQAALLWTPRMKQGGREG